MPTIGSFAKPKFITGSCLCGSLKYRVDFPGDHDFVSRSGTCQCTQDRKITGSLWHQGHGIKPAEAFQFISSTETLKHYKASPKADRGFCGKCGSYLYWKPVSGASLSLAVGTIDALYLFGEGADGVEVPKEGFGFALANGGGDHEWCRNEIVGVTDGLRVPGSERGCKRETE